MHEKNFRQDIERTKALGKFVSQYAADSLHEMLLAVLSGC